MTELFGINLDELEDEAPAKLVVPPMVPGRVCHIDADFLAYQVAADNEKSVAEMEHNCRTIVEKLRLLAGAETVILHLTPKGSTKGDRHNIALLKEYQANRKDKIKPQFLNYMREWMHKEMGAKLHMTCEADDGMSMAQYEAIAAGNRNLSIIATKDKDLAMVPGLMLNWDTHEITDLEDPWGYIMLDESKTSKKVRGRGNKVFWASLLMGDSADNIAGLPKCCVGKYLSASGKPKACGPVLTYEILATVNNNKQAFQVVKELFEAAGKQGHLTNWRNGEQVKPGVALMSEAQLLWMRRKDDPKDVLHWMKEHCL